MGTVAGVFGIIVHAAKASAACARRVLPSRRPLQDGVVVVEHVAVTTWPQPASGHVTNAAERLSLGLGGGVLGMTTQYEAVGTYSLSSTSGSSAGIGTANEEVFGVAWFGHISLSAAKPVGPGVLSLGGRFDYLSAVPVGYDTGTSVDANSSGGTREATASSGGDRAVRFSELFGYGLNASYRVPF